MLSQADWHQRFVQQARWTQAIRRYLYQKIQIQNARRVLEAGCGTGAILSDLRASTPALVTGIDLDLDRLIFARSSASPPDLAAADGLRLPFPEGAFDVSLCHFYLLWVAEHPVRVAEHPGRVAEQVQAVREMARVIRPGGYVIALAEPDYGGRIDYPDSLSELGRAQEQSLQRQGADPHTGRRLAELMLSAGLKEVQTGLLGGEWSSANPPSVDFWQQEWAVLEEDLHETLTPTVLEHLKEIDRAAWERGERILFVPTFYSIGKVA
jgi:SAM-dependent methyltransferase